MSDAEQEPPLPRSEATAEQLLTRLLELIKNTASIADFTPEVVGDALGVPIQRYGPNKWGSRARLTADWSYGLTAIEDTTDGARVQLTFFDNEGGSAGDMADICHPDFDDFTGSLRSAGFAKSSFHGEHGETVFDAYTRAKVQVEVRARGEAGRSSSTLLHQCVQSVTVL